MHARPLLSNAHPVGRMRTDQQAVLLYQLQNFSELLHAISFPHTKHSSVRQLGHQLAPQVNVSSAPSVTELTEDGEKYIQSFNCSAQFGSD